MNKIFSIIIFTTFVLGINTKGQDRICGHEIFQQKIDKDPFLKASQNDYFKNYDAENKQIAEEAARVNSKGTAIYQQLTIPLVFHIVLNPTQLTQLGGEAGVIDRINSQLLALNEDFGGTNTDLSNVPSDFQPLIGNANIRFALAKRDITGKARIGIVIVQKPASFNGFNSQDNTMKSSAQGSDGWDYTKYINVWVTNILPPTGSSGQVLGYAYNSTYANQFGINPNNAGVVMHYLALGRRTNVGQKFYSANAEKGRTLTHELGHYFNIWHIWGKSAQITDASCTDDDGIDDTPVQADANTTCPTGKQPNCSQNSFVGGEMYMNYMDYSSDACTRMFSKGQVARMRFETDDVSKGQLHSISLNPHLAYWPADISPVEYNNKLQVAPNPNNGKFNIHFFEKYDKLNTIDVLNTVGQVVTEVPVTDQEKLNYNFDITGLAKGIYIVQLHFDQGIISRKIVVQ